MKRKLPDIHEKRRQEQQESSYEIIKVISSIFPLGSTPFALFEAIFGHPATRRRDEFIQELAVRLATLEQKVAALNLGELLKNDSFITTAMHAFPIALRNHQKEKREALYNVILNAALSQDLDDSVQQLFLSFVDTLTVTHLKLLKTFHFYLKNGSKIPPGLGVDPETRITRDPAPVFMEMHFPGYTEREDLYQQFWRDLYIRGLVRSESIRMPDGHFDYLFIKNQPTELGEQFLHFIESPVELDEERAV